MRSKQSSFLILALVALLSLAHLPDSYAGEHRLAYSKKLGVEVFAKAVAGEWCNPTIDLRLNSKDKTFFSSDELQNLFSKIGRVIEEECPAANAANLKGYADGEAVVYRGHTEKASGWLLVPVTVVSGTTVKPALASGEVSANGDDEPIEPQSGKREPEVTNNSTKSYSIKNTSVPAKAVWFQRTWDDPNDRGMQAYLMSDMGELVGFGCYESSKTAKSEYYLRFDVLPYNVTSSYPSHLFEVDIGFPDRKIFKGTVYLDLEEAHIIFIDFDREKSDQFYQLLASGNGRFELRWISATPLKKDRKEQEQVATRVLASLKAQGPLSINALDGKHGPLKRILSLYKQACLGEKDGQPFLEVVTKESNNIWLESVFESARQNMGIGQVVLGFMYLTGEDVELDPKEACALFEKARKQHYEHELLSVGLGVCHIEGVVVQKDERKGIALLEDAADEGNNFAVMALTRAYIDGKYVIADQAEAKRLLERAIALGHPFAAQVLEKLNVNGNADAPNTKQYTITKTAPKEKPLWEQVIWSDPEAPGVILALRSADKSLIKIGCAGEETYTLTFEFLPYQLVSPYEKLDFGADLEFPDGAKLPVRAELNFEHQDIRILKLTQSKVRDLVEAIAKNNGIFQLKWKSRHMYKVPAMNRIFAEVLSALKTQGPLKIEAPEDNHGPLKSLMGVFNQACLGEKNGQPALEAVGGWSYSSGDIMPGFATAMLRYSAGALQIDCMRIGDKKGGFVNFRLSPYKYMRAKEMPLIFSYPNGNKFSVAAQADSDSWALKAKLDIASIRKLVQEIFNNGGQLKLEWDDSHFLVKHVNGLPYLKEFLSACY